MQIDDTERAIEAAQRLLRRLTDYAAYKRCGKSTASALEGAEDHFEIIGRALGYELHKLNEVA